MTKRRVLLVAVACVVLLTPASADKRLFTLLAQMTTPALAQQATGGSRPVDIAFRVQMIDPGFSESVAVADFNRDGRPDILSAEHWYEAPNWTKHKIRDIPFNGSYIDNFSDLPINVDGDSYTDIVQIAYFARRIVWLKNPGKSRGAWIETEIDAVGPTEFAFLADLNNDGKALEILPQFTGAGNAPLTWYEVVNGKWVKHVVSSQSYGHGIGAGDVNGDKRNDISTPAGWLEAPADVRASGEWTLHPTDWTTPPPQPGTPAGATPAALPGTAPGTPQPAARPAEYAFMYVIDINKDGRNDILTTMAHSYGVLWFEQRADGQWTRRIIDSTWANAHSSALADVNADGQPDLVTAKRYFGRAGTDPTEREPMGIYWYQFRPGPKGTVEWIAPGRPITRFAYRLPSRPLNRLLPQVDCPPMPKVVRIALVLLFGSTAAITDGAVAGVLQSPSSFSGHWVLVSVSPARPGYDQFWLGTEATVTHSAASLVITRVSPPPQREARFTLNGTESRNEYVVAGQRLFRDSRATSSGGVLLISTDTTDANGRRWLSNIMRWSFDPDGTLVVGDTEICGKGECPSVITTLKFKKKP